MFRHATSRAGIICQLVLILTFAVSPAVHGQGRQYIIGPAVDLVSGSDSHPINSLSNGLSQTSTRPASFFRLYPAISLATSEGHSSLTASYALGLAGTRSDVDYSTISHAASLTFSYPASSKWQLNLTESFLATSDSASFNGLRGATPSPDQFRFLFDPVALRLSARSNTAAISTEYTLNPRSALSFSASHALRNYGSGEALYGALSDQQGITGTVNYRQKTTARDAWTVGYTGSYFSFQNFGNMASHNVHVGYSAGIAPEVTLELTVGASRVGSLGTMGSSGTPASYVGYNSSISVSKRKENDSFSVHYRQDAGQPTGLGSVSDTRQAGVAVGHKLKTMALFLDASVFDTQGRLDNTLQTRGVSATASIGIPLTETLSINGGAQYLRFDQAAPFGFTQQRFFVTLKYNDPKLWTIFR
jgi:hypothetical protein